MTAAVSGTHPVIRAAGPLDAGAVGGLLTQGAAGFDWMPKLHSAAEDVAHAGHMIGRGWVQVIERGGAVCGFMARNEAEIHALYIDKYAQNQGLGSRLLHAAQSGCAHLALWTFQANTGAQRFYLRHGFRETARTDGASTDEKLPDIHYVWSRNGDIA